MLTITFVFMIISFPSNSAYKNGSYRFLLRFMDTVQNHILLRIVLATEIFSSSV